MDEKGSTMVQQVARAALAFERRRTGHVPQAVTVVMGGDTLVITLHASLSPAERAVARNPAGAAQVQEFHRALFHSSAVEFRQEIQQITGVAVREAAAEVEPATGAMVKVFTTGTVVQGFLLTDGVPTDSCHTTGAGALS